MELDEKNIVKNLAEKVLVIDQKLLDILLLEKLRGNKNDSLYW